jgi:hypothetical protein
MNAEQILKAMRTQRELGVPMGGTPEAPRRMTLLRPTELEIQRDLLKLLPGKDGTPMAKLEVDPDKVHNYVVGWTGYTEADLLGPAGGSDAAPFAPELVREWLANNPADIHVLVEALLIAVATHINSKAEAAKN